MDYKINKIQQYYISKQDNKNFIKNIENLGPKDVKEIVNKIFVKYKWINFQLNQIYFLNKIFKKYKFNYSKKINLNKKSSLKNLTFQK